MKIKFIWLLISFLLVFSVNAFDIDCDSTAALARLLTKTVQKYHYKPRAIDDKFSELVYKNFLDEIDPYRILFSSDCINKFEKYRHSLDDEILSGKTEFLKLTTSLYEDQLKLLEDFADSLVNEDIDFSINDSISFGKDVRYPDNKGHILRYKRWLKYGVLFSYMKLEEDSLNDSIKITNEKTKEFLENAVEIEKCRIKARFNSPGKIEGIVNKVYLSAIAKSFDPHTTFITPAEMTQYREDLSSEAGSFGIAFKSNRIGEIEIEEIVPGGPAWRSCKINVGDIVLSVKNDNGEEIDLLCAPSSLINEFFAGIKFSSATFKIRKKNGKTIKVKLRKSILDVEKNKIKSFIVNGENKIAYIYLPVFYTDYSAYSNYSQGCSNAITKELLKLKRKGVKGLILDLRGNGGGDLAEAQRLAGTFIDKGALFITDTRYEDPVTSKDLAQGAIYEDPMVILVNSLSASASELLTGVMQDYNRAVILGSNTYGKSTMQTVYPIDLCKVDTITEYDMVPPAYLAMTIGGFYRVSGKSHQFHGVTPDINLPDIYSKIELRESFLDGALKLDDIDKKVYAYPLDSLPVCKLRDKSNSRVENNITFKYIKKESDEIPRFDSVMTFPLDFAGFKQSIDFFEYWKDTLESISDSLDIVKLEDEFEFDELSADEKKDEDDFFYNLKFDAYVNEANNVINDLIEMLNLEKDSGK